MTKEEKIKIAREQAIAYSNLKSTGLFIEHATIGTSVYVVELETNSRVGDSCWIIEFSHKGYRYINNVGDKFTAHQIIYTLKQMNNKLNDFSMLR